MFPFLQALERSSWLSLPAESGDLGSGLWLILVLWPLSPLAHYLILRVLEQLFLAVSACLSPVILASACGSSLFYLLLCGLLSGLPCPSLLAESGDLGFGLWLIFVLVAPYPLALFYFVLRAAERSSGCLCLLSPVILASACDSSAPCRFLTCVSST